MRGGGGGAGPAFGPAPFLLGGLGAAKGLLPCFLVPKRNQPTACTLALWWLKFGPTEPHVPCGGGGGLVVFPSLHACRRQDVSTTQVQSEALGCSGRGGFSPLGPS